MKHDRNFDDLAERFQKKIYGGLKGEIRLAVLWRDIQELLAAFPHAPLRILDVGGGFAQLAIRLAQQGHQVVVNDLSEKMLEMAMADADTAGVVDAIGWHPGPYQLLEPEYLGKFDLILCHALMEWLVEPQKLLRHLQRFLAPSGRLSLTFYNYHSLVYRNLIRGNFRVLEGEFTADSSSLTPGNPLRPERVANWIEAVGMRILSTSGVRVFSDYVVEQRGGNALPQEVLRMELRHSRDPSYCYLGRYIHYICESF